jgi:hypothetical protein
MSRVKGTDKSGNSEKCYVIEGSECFLFNPSMDIAFIKPCKLVAKGS